MAGRQARSAGPLREPACIPAIPASGDGVLRRDLLTSAPPVRSSPAQGLTGRLSSPPSPADAGSTHYLRQTQRSRRRG